MIEVSRRAVLAGGVVVVGAMALPSRMLRSQSSPIPARRFFDSVGICTHPNWQDTVWGRANWNQAFLQTGVKFTRGKIGLASTGVAALVQLRPLFESGVKICVTIAENRGAAFDLEQTKASLDFLADRVGAENLCGIESANEYNNPHGRPADWGVRLRSFQNWLHNTVRANRVFDNVPLIAPSIWGRIRADYRELGDLGPNVDRGCIHYYTGGRRPTRVGVPLLGMATRAFADASLPQALIDAKLLAPTKPLWMTEFGYALAGPNAAVRGSVSEKAAAKYLVRGLFDVFAEGVEKTFIYTLIDDAGLLPVRYHGLMDGTLQPRLGFFAVRNLIALFRDDSTRSNARPLGYSVAGATDRLRQHLFHKSDGSFLLVLYRDVDSSDRWTGEAIEVAPEHIQLTLAETVTKVQIFVPNANERPIQTLPRVDALKIAVVDDVTVVKITP